MGNKVLIILAKLVGIVALAFIVDIAFQYFEQGAINYYKALRFGLILGVVLVTGREIRDYIVKKKNN